MELSYFYQDMEDLDIKVFTLSALQIGKCALIKVD